MKSTVNFSELHVYWRGSKYKGTTYRSYSLAKPFRENGKNRREIVLKLGKLSDADVIKWRQFIDSFKKSDSFFTTLDDINPKKHYAYLDIAVANAIWDEWELDKVFKRNSRKDINVATIARILAVNRCIHPASKSQVPDWFKKTALPFLLNINSETVNASRIFRELTFIEKCKEDICQHLFDSLHQKNPKSMKTVFYDLSSAAFTGSKCILVKWGHCKEGYRYHVVLAIVVNQDGLPFYWEVLPGNTADSNTIEWLLDRLKKKFKIANITVVFDRGMVSDDNLSSIETAQVKYISAMDRNQIENITNIDFIAFSHLTVKDVDTQADDLSKFTKLNDTTYYREIKIENKRRYILCFNPQLFKDQRRAREQAVENFRGVVNSLNEQLLGAKKSRQREATQKKYEQQLMKMKLNSFVNISLRGFHIKRKNDEGKEHSVRTYKGEVQLDADKILIAGKLDGFWLLVTNHNEKIKDKFSMSAPQAINPYREKVVIESAFRDIKSFVEVAPVFVWTETHVKAHFNICVLSYLINRTITLRLHQHKGNISAYVVAHEKLYQTLSECQLNQLHVDNVKLTNHKLTCPTKEQIELLERLNLQQLLRFGFR